jgi:hypothetical protein
MKKHAKLLIHCGDDDEGTWEDDYSEESYP